MLSSWTFTASTITNDQLRNFRVDKRYMFKVKVLKYFLHSQNRSKSWIWRNVPLYQLTRKFAESSSSLELFPLKWSPEKSTPFPLFKCRETCPYMITIKRFSMMWSLTKMYHKSLKKIIISVSTNIKIGIHVIMPQITIWGRCNSGVPQYDLEWRWGRCRSLGSKDLHPVILFLHLEYVAVPVNHHAEKSV